MKFMRKVWPTAFKVYIVYSVILDLSIVIGAVWFFLIR